MAPPIIAWQRFWLPRGHPLLLEQGYLPEPGDVPAKDALPLATLGELLSRKRCVALLGEPGMGKTTTLKQEKAVIAQHCARHQAELLWLNLNAFGNEDRLARALFESEKMKTWKQGSQLLYVVLDSFDECHLRIDTLSALLQQELGELPTERLALFIACRPAHWPSSLEKRLRELWPGELFAEVELAPLRKSDVQALARASQVEPDTFCAEVERREATSLATRPVTLRFLLDAFRRGRLPADRWQLYWEGCRSLAQENNPERQESALRGKLKPEERLAVASRIAALLLLANREDIWLRPPDEEWPGSTSLDELAGGAEPVLHGQSIEVTDEALRETLDSGLFGAAGPYRIGWAHRTYAEFLAAVFLSRREVPPAQLDSLLRHPEDSSRSVMPQLQGVATWLALQGDAACELLMEMDPWVLLGSEAFARRPELSERLVEALLHSLAHGRSLGGYDHRKHYFKLAHPRLDTQLRVYMREPRSSERVLSHVFQIAAACGQRSLASDCGELARDDSRPLQVRLEALDLLGSLGECTEKGRFLSWARGEALADPEGYLQEAALMMLWPECLSTEQLFALLQTRAPHPVRRISRLAVKLRVHLPRAELPRALQWLVARETQGDKWAEFREEHGFTRLGSELLDRAWEYLDDANLFEAFCATAWVWLRIRRDHQPLEPWANDKVGRWRVIDGLAARRKRPEDLLWLRMNRQFPLGGEDFQFLLERAQSTPLPEDQARWADLARDVFSESEPLHRETLVQAARHHEVIAEIFAWQLRGVAQGSAGAAASPAAKSVEPASAVSPQVPPSVKECEHLLHRIAQGEALRWADLVTLLLPSDEEMETSFLTKSKRWGELPPESQFRVVGAGRAFLIRCRPNAEPWLEGGSFDWTAACAYWAFILLAQVQPSELTLLPASVWRNWTSLVLAFPLPRMTWEEDIEEGKLRHRLLALASQHAPVDVLRSGRRLLQQGLKGSGLNAFLWGLHVAWRNEQMVQVTLDKLREPSLEVAMLERLLKALLIHGEPEARARATALLSSTTIPEQRIRVAAMMILHDAGGCWETVWPWVQRDVAFGRAVLDEMARNEGDAAILAEKFHPEQLVDLYLWIERHGGPRAPRTEQGVASRRKGRHGLQASAWSMLMGAGAPEVCHALERLNQELPGDDMVHVALVRAQENMRQRAWQPPSPSTLLRLLGSQQARVVQNGAQLLDVLMDSLARLEEELHGETPALGFLWNEWTQEGRTQSKPKEENDLSDWIKRHLEKDLLDRQLIVNREVEIRSTEHARAGQRVDIRVDATASTPDGREERISVIIEVKGCWNRGLWSAMKDQLVDRYLEENACRYGLYLVGWYAGAAWNDTTPTPQEGRVSLERARQLLEMQAQELSRGRAQVRAFVLDAAFRTEPGPPSSRKRR